MAFSLLFFLSLSVFSQSYPIQLSTQLVPPYSGYLPDYADPFNEKLKIILQLNDFSVADHSVKLKIRIEGNNFTIQSKPFFNPGPVVLTPGVPELLTGSALAPYLSSQNLDFSGIDPLDYENRKVLPEGRYTICITAYDYYNTGEVQVSNVSCVTAWFMLSDPPFLNLPFCGAILTPLNPQQLFFQWTPMNMASPNSFASTEYDFELFEIRPAGADPNAIVLQSLPVFTITTTDAFFNYGMTETPLITGMGYAWRVRARDITGRDLFKNNGYSQVCMFTYGNILSSFDPSAFTLNLFAQTSTHRQAKLWWNNISNFTEYNLQVRKQGTTNWFDFFTSSSQYKVNNLEPQTAYEARVKGSGSDLESGWSNVVAFATNPVPVIGCNDENMPVNALLASPLAFAAPGMLFSVGQFEMRVTAISAEIQPGYFSGYGEIRMFGIPVSVIYENILVDDNQVVQGGKVTALSQGIDNWINEWVNNQQNNTNQFDFNIDIDTIITDNGNTIIITEDGDTISPGIGPQSWPALITDANGDSWVITENGIVIFLTDRILQIIEAGVAAVVNEYSVTHLQNLKQTFNNEKNAVETMIQENRQQNEISTEENEFSNEYGGFMFDFEQTENQPETEDEFKSASVLFKTTQFKLELAISSREYALSKTTEDDFKYLAQWLTYNDENIALHIHNGIQNNVLDELMAEDVKTAFVRLVEKVLTEVYK